jgi:hypothetical protein
LARSGKRVISSTSTSGEQFLEFLVGLLRALVDPFEVGHQLGGDPASRCRPRHEV